VLISHSQLEYSGGIAFLIDELGLDPKIFYTTQSIVREAPLNLHESLLSLRCKAYNKKVFSKLYKIYESINIIKPQQKISYCANGPDDANTVPPKSGQPTAMEPEEPKPAIGEVEKIIYFTCFSAGGNMGSLSWRLSYGIVNILYLVEYNNYSMYHINGLELPQIMQPTDILITDTYKKIDDS
jgi:Cft2 family RNA processing exonuclease